MIFNMIKPTAFKIYISFGKQIVTMPIAEAMHANIKSFVSFFNYFIPSKIIISQESGHISDLVAEILILT